MTYVHTRNRPDIRGFFGQYRWLSNFDIVDIVFEDMHYLATENAYQAAKCLFIEDRIPFQTCAPKDAKRMGKNVICRENWNQIRGGVMLEVNLWKYSPIHHPNKAQKLIDTDDALLIEENTWHDNFWGDCTCGKRATCIPPGHNELGKTLMEIRTALQAI